MVLAETQIFCVFFVWVFGVYPKPKPRFFSGLNVYDIGILKSIFFVYELQLTIEMSFLMNLKLNFVNDNLHAVFGSQTPTSS